MARFLQLNLSVNAAILNCYGPHVVATTDSERLISRYACLYSGYRGR